MRLLLSLCFLGLPAALNAATLVERPATVARPPFVIAGSALPVAFDELTEAGSKLALTGAAPVMRVSSLFDPASDMKVLAPAMSGAAWARTVLPPISNTLRWRQPQGMHLQRGHKSLLSNRTKPDIHQVPLPASFAAMLTVLSGWLFMGRRPLSHKASVKVPEPRSFRRTNFSPATLCRDFRRLSPETP
jgi:hypothetical protein